MCPDDGAFWRLDALNNSSTLRLDMSTDESLFLERFKMVPKRHLVFGVVDCGEISNRSLVVVDDDVLE